MAFVQHQKSLAGVRTPVLECGAEAPEAVIFMHGNPGCGEDWRGLMEMVQPFGRALAPDMPGFGQAEKPREFTYNIESYARHIAAIVDEFELKKVHLVLHDFGGPWGLAWASMNPDKVASISLINIGVLPGYKWHYMARIWRTPILGELFQATTTRWGLNLALKHGNPRGLPPEFVDRMYRNLDRGTNYAVRKLYRATDDPGGASELVRTALAPLDLDALVIWGKADPYVPHRYAEVQKTVFPRAEVHYLEDSGHFPFADNLDGVAEYLLPFLRRQLNSQTA